MCSISQPTPWGRPRRAGLSPRRATGRDGVDRWATEEGVSFGLSRWVQT